MEKISTFITFRNISLFISLLQSEHATGKQKESFVSNVLSLTTAVPLSETLKFKSSDLHRDK